MNWYFIAGVIVSIPTNIIGTIIKNRLDTKRDIIYTKTAILDSITDIITMCDKICDSQNTFNIGRIQSIDDELSDNIQKYIYHIPNNDLRNNIRIFYKNLKKAKNNALSSQNSTTETLAMPTHQEKIVTEFKQIKTFAEQLQVKLYSYQFKAFWILF